MSFPSPLPDGDVFVSFASPGRDVDAGVPERRGRGRGRGGRRGRGEGAEGAAARLGARSATTTEQYN